MPQIHVYPIEATEKGGELTLGAFVEMPAATPTDRQSLWYRLPSEHISDITTSSDPFVLALLCPAMQAPADLVVHGQVSPSLLRHLDEFQSAWALWRPDIYTKIEILADTEMESPKVGESRAITAYSGGVDSNFTIFRHRSLPASRQTLNLQAALFVHGFDITLRKQDDFERVCLNVKPMLDSLGVTLIPIATNQKKLAGGWHDSHGISIASALSLFQGGFNTGLIPSTYPYNRLYLPHGSNPVTDWLCSSTAFEIQHDGAGWSRFDKVRILNEWPELRQHLRVCLVGERKDRNCGKCEKCIRTILCFRLWGFPLPPCFDRDVTDAEILRVRFKADYIYKEWTDMLACARRNGVKASWLRAAGICMRLNALRLRLKKAAGS